MSDIVYVDDEPNELLSQATTEQKARIRDFAFDEGVGTGTAFDAARTASLWLFDFFLVDEHSSPEGSENGLSLFNRWRRAVETGRPTTVLVSNHLESVLGYSPGPVARHHAVAKRLGVEWIGAKSVETIERIIQLADASKVIASKCAQGEGEDLAQNFFDLERLCFDILGVNRRAVWSNSAQRQIDRARPPRVGPPLDGVGAAMPVVRWLVSHVLPYPSFLLSDTQAAVRLRVTPDSFRQIVAGNAQGRFDRIRYKGPLATFSGRRWWRPAIDNLVWELSQGKESYDETLEELATGTKVDWLHQADPVVVSDEDLVETDFVADASECVRAADEDFPANVDPAWVLIDKARADRRLASKVIYEDRPLLEPDE